MRQASWPPWIPPLVGRSTEIETCAAMVEAVRAGRGGILVLTGEAGIGKSTLLGYTRSVAEQRAVRVQSFAAEELEARLPFATISRCLDISPLSPRQSADQLNAPQQSPIVLSGLSGRQLEAAITHELLAIVDDWCAESPLMITVDDLQWADPETVVVLHMIGRSIRELPLLLACAVRTTPSDYLRQRLLHSFAERGSTVLELTPLDEASAVEMAEQLTDSAAGTSLRTSVREAGGNPLYVSELVRGLLQAGEISIRDGVAEVGPAQGQTSGPTVSTSLSDAIWHRLSFLSPAARQAVQAASLLGESFELRDLAATMRCSAHELVAPVMEAVRLGVLQDVGGRLAFRHGLIRRALLDDLPPSVRATLHLGAAKALADADAAVEQVAGQLLAADGLESWCVSWILNCGVELINRAPAVAVDLLERATDLAPDGGPDRLRLRAQLAKALLWHGKVRQAVDVAYQVLQTGDAIDRSVVASAVEVAWRSCFAGRPDLAQQAITAAQVRFGPVQDAQRLANAYLALVWTLTGRMDDAAVLARDVLAAPTQPGTNADRADLPAEQALAIILVCRFQNVAAARAADRVLAVIARNPGAYDPTMRLTAYVVKGYAMTSLDQFKEADRTFNEGFSFVGPTAVAATVGWHCHRAILRFWRGDWDDATTEAQAAAEVEEYVDDRYLRASDCRGLIEMVLLRRGRPATAGGSPAITSGPTRSEALRIYEYWPKWVTALRYEAEGDWRAALNLLLATWSTGTEALSRRSLSFLVPDIVRLAVQLDDIDCLRPLVAVLVEHAAIDVIPTVQGVASLADGVVDNDAGKVREACDQLETSGRVLLAGLAHEQAALLLARTGRTTEARVELDLATERYDELGASWDTARAVAALRNCGLRRGVRGRRQRPRTGWEALTVTERKIADLVAQGHSNRDIAAQMYLSRRTVQFHVSGILAKIGASSRVEIAAVAARRADSGTAE